MALAHLHPLHCIPRDLSGGKAMQIIEVVPWQPRMWIGIHCFAVAPFICLFIFFLVSKTSFFFGRLVRASACACL